MNKTRIFIMALITSLAFANIAIAATEAVTWTEVNKQDAYAKALAAKRNAAQAEFKQLAKQTQAAWKEAKAYWQKAKTDKKNREKYNQLAKQKATEAKALANARNQALAEWKALAKQVTAAWNERKRLAVLAKAGKSDSSESATTAAKTPAEDTNTTTSGNEVTKSVALAWAAPTKKADGSSLSPAEIDGFRIYFGKDRNSLAALVDVQDSKATEFTLKDVEPGTYYFAVSTYDVDGRESGLSNIRQKTI